MLIQLYSFTQTAYPRKAVIGKDTVCISLIEQVRIVNKVFVDRDECRELNDSLNSQLENYEDLVRQQDFLIDSKEKELVIEQKINSEKTGIIENQEKELKQTNRKLQWLKIQRTVFGAVAVIATSIIIYQHIDKNE